VHILIFPGVGLGATVTEQPESKAASKTTAKPNNTYLRANFIYSNLLPDYELANSTTQLIRANNYRISPIAQIVKQRRSKNSATPCRDIFIFTSVISF
jgi:hypothetical protein